MRNDYSNYEDYDEQNNPKQGQSPKKDNHNHEFQSTSDQSMKHSHRIAGVTGPPIKKGKSHVHEVRVFIDTFGNHYHEISDTTGPALYLNSGKHIHLLEGTTSYDDGHDHRYYFTTLIEDPINVPKNSKS